MVLSQIKEKFSQDTNEVVEQKENPINLIKSIPRPANSITLKERISKEIEPHLLQIGLPTTI